MVKALLTHICALTFEATVALADNTKLPLDFFETPPMCDLWWQMIFKRDYTLTVRYRELLFGLHLIWTLIKYSDNLESFLKHRFSGSNFTIGWISCFSVSYDRKLNIFVFWSASRTKKKTSLDSSLFLKTVQAFKLFSDMLWPKRPIETLWQQRCIFNFYFSSDLVSFFGQPLNHSIKSWSYVEFLHWIH